MTSLLIIATFSNLLLTANGKYSAGVINTKINWVYVDRFCFVNDSGRLKFSFVFPASYGAQQMYLYYDSRDQWPSAYRTPLNCSEKVSLLRPTNKQLVELGAPQPFHLADGSTCNHFERNGVAWLNCTGERTFRSQRERWWYIALGNCSSDKGVYAEYKLMMTNGLESEPFFYHFSADEFYILPTDMLFLGLELLMLLIALIIARMLLTRQMLHSTFKLFLVSLTLEVASLILDVTDYGRYAGDGVGFRTVRLAAGLCRAASVCLFMLLLVLLAKGWTVTRGRLSSKSSNKIGAFMIILSATYAALFIYQIKMFDPGEVLYLYESPAGYGLIALRLITWGWFLHAIYNTLVRYPEKRQFYYKFAMFYSMWFWIGPITILIINHAIDNWFREKLANGIENAVVFLGFLCFLYITRPSAANGNFPYHVRTAQIDCINEAALKDPNAATDLPHHAYEVQYSADKEQVFTISTSRNPVEQELQVVEHHDANGTMGSERQVSPGASSNSSEGANSQRGIVRA